VVVYDIQRDPAAVLKEMRLGNSDIFENAIADSATAYVDQNQHDFDSVKARSDAGVFWTGT
jgi:hypothetical protein